MKALICTHAPQEGLGFLEDFLPRHGAAFEYQELFNESGLRPLENYQGLVVMGGPMNADQLKEYPFLRTDYLYLEEALKIGLPVLGICLGAQLLARALGEKVYKSVQPELGWYDLHLTSCKSLIFRGFPEHCQVFQWHGDTFDLPHEAKLLAGTTSCQNQAFSYNEKAFGLQFHLEVTAAMVEEWLRDETSVKEWGFESAAIKKATAQNIKNAAALCSRLGLNFVELMKKQRRE